MRFGWTQEQRSFAEALDGLLVGADVPRVAREWADGAPDAGLALWSRLADLGVAGLTVPEALGGLGASVVDVAVASEAFGFHAVPGPWIETVALAPALLAAVGDPTDLLPALAEGKAVISVAAAPLAAWAADAEVATQLLAVIDGELRLASPGRRMESVDRTRSLTELAGGQSLGAVTTVLDDALDRAVVAASAHLLGAGRRMLQDAVAYVGARKQFGRPVGEYQAVKHLLADVRVALDFAAPLVLGAALALDDTDQSRSQVARSVSAAKVATSDAAYLAARTALQVHGAIGYTEEYDLSLWFTRTRALVSAWGTTGWHRARVLAALEEARA